MPKNNKSTKVIVRALYLVAIVVFRMSASSLVSCLRFYMYFARYLSFKIIDVLSFMPEGVLMSSRHREHDCRSSPFQAGEPALHGAWTPGLGLATASSAGLLPQS